MLSLLEHQSLLKSVVCAEAEERRRTAEILKEKISQLKQQKTALEERLSKPLPALSDSSQVILKKLDEMKWMYALLGTSISVLSPDTVVVQLSTSHRGVYLERFTLHLRLTGLSFQLLRHDVPPSVPMSSLSKLLESSLPEFISTVHGHIRAFLSRREEARLAKKILQRFLVDDIACVYPFDNISFMLRTSGTFEPFQFYVRLHFNDNSSLIPSEVIIEPPQNASDEAKKTIRKRWTSALSNLLLADAAHELFRTLDDLVASSEGSPERSAVGGSSESSS